MNLSIPVLSIFQNKLNDEIDIDYYNANMEEHFTNMNLSYNDINKIDTFLKSIVIIQN
jgi:hypothetical protein